MSPLIDHWKECARQLKTEVYALYLAYKDPRTPWYAKVYTAVVVGYALSPIDLIPDFIPVLGYLDDLVIVPLGAFLALKMIPAQVMQESREKARAMMDTAKPVNKLAAALIILVWMGMIAVVGIIAYRLYTH